MISSTQTRTLSRIGQLPWWFIILMLTGVILVYQFATSENYGVIFQKIANGLVITIFTAVVAYVMALIIGLLAGLGRISKNPIAFNVSTLYVQVIRGVPIIVQLIYNAFVITPALIAFINLVGKWLAPVLGAENFLTALSVQDISFLARSVIGLALAYGGFEAETIRAGIESIGKGQMEAARSLGMSYVQAMRHVILPQAFRRILPTLGNDFISMIKDSSLVGVLGVKDVTREGQLYATASFRYLETFSSVAFVYLILTFLLALGVRWIENRLGQGRS